MKPDDADRFYEGLKTLELFFRDPLTEEHELLYWDVMRELCTISEWEYACHRAMESESFHTVPLPAVLRTYADEYRKEQRIREAELEAQRRAALAPPPAPGVPREEALANIRGILAMLESTMDMRDVVRETRANEVAQRKTLLLAQAQQIIDNADDYHDYDDPEQKEAE